MVRPIPRRRALRLLGGVLVTAAVPGALRPTTARAHHAVGTLTKACNPSCGGAYPVKCVCPVEGGCYIGGCGAPGSTCCCLSESNAGTPGAVVCPPGYACGGGKGKPNCRCKKPCGTTCCTKPGQTCCGDVCCESGEECADRDLGYCCPVRTRACRGGKTVACCKPDQHCCSGTCCPSGSRCQPGKKGGAGTCGPCPSTSRKCGKTCCTKDESCCDGRCCPKSQKCCPAGTCCGKSSTCCGPTCCGKEQRCCGDHCCQQTSTCCGEGCCRKGTICARGTNSAGVTCCPEVRVAQTRAGKVCCPSGYYANDDTCCPTGRACSDCDPPCGRDEYCQHGYCLPAP